LVLAQTLMVRTAATADQLMVDRRQQSNCHIFLAIGKGLGIQNDISQA
jgi:hypothetical protein